jgi:hypothetical protein
MSKPWLASYKGTVDGRPRNAQYSEQYTTSRNITSAPTHPRNRFPLVSACTTVAASIRLKSSCQTVISGRSLFSVLWQHFVNHRHSIASGEMSRRRQQICKKASSIQLKFERIHVTLVVRPTCFTTFCFNAPLPIYTIS